MAPAYHRRSPGKGRPQYHNTPSSRYAVAATTSKKWNRSSSSRSSTGLNVGSSTTPRYSWKRPRSDYGSTNKLVMNHPPGSAVGHNKTWTRETANLPGPQSTSQPPSPSAKSLSKDGDGGGDGDSDVQWTRIGKNKLVVRQKDGDDVEKGSLGAAKQAIVPEPPKDAILQTGAMKKIGRNKLVLHSQGDVHPSTEKSNGKTALDTIGQNGALTKLGNNKLVSQSHNPTGNRSDGATFKPAVATAKPNVPRKKLEPAAAQLRSAKRIKITAESAAAAGESDASLADDGPASGMDDEDGEDGFGKKASNPAHDGLTTFAYCQPTDPKVATTRNPHKKRARLSAAHHSLVRVKTTDATRICPRFARGMICQEEGCLLRHDVPPEAAQPTCYYFSQFNGMCLKENCPFRHVKVGSTTEPCPRYLKTGYCTLEGCTLAHVQHKNKSFTASSKREKGPMAPGEKDLVFYDD